MFGALLGAAGGIASGLFGAKGAKDAAKAQAKIAKKQLKFAKKQWNEMNSLQKGLYEDQVKTIDQGYARSTGLADAERNALSGYAQDLRRTGLGALNDVTDATKRRNLQGFQENQNALTGARDASLQGLTNARDASLAGMAGARDTSIAGLLKARDASMAGITGARDQAIQGLTNARTAGLGNIWDARDQSIAGLTKARDAGLANIWDARDQSIAGFQPAMDAGNNALAAYAYNMGVGKAPAGYQGLEMTPGAQFLMKQGVEDIQGSAAGSGTLNSGATLKALEQYRQGLASTDRDTQLQQLFSLAGMGQTAAGNIANLRTGAASDANALRTGTAGNIANLRTGAANDAVALRTGTAENIANFRAGAAGQLADLRTSAAGDIADLRTGAAKNMATVRGESAQNMADLRGSAADRLVANRNALTAGQNAADSAWMNGRYSIAGDYTDAMRDATTGYTQRQIALDAARTADLGTARTNRANLYGTGAASYGQNALTAMANRGDAAAAGAVGQSNAWANAINTGFGIWGALNRGGSGGFTNPFSGWLNSQSRLGASSDFSNGTPTLY